MYAKMNSYVVCLRTETVTCACMLQVVQMSLAGGIMKTIHPGDVIRINDRFFLGGPLTLRGFEMKGVGPRDAGGDTLRARPSWCRLKLFV